MFLKPLSKPYVEQWLRFQQLIIIFIHRANVTNDLEYKKMIKGSTAIKVTAYLMQCPTQNLNW